jgi:hypothetical protein
MTGHLRAVSPERCVVALAIPVSERRFREHLADIARHDFVRTTCPDWARYEAFARHIREFVRRFAARGVPVVENATLQQFESCFATSQVVILFAHWAAQAVEFDDGLAPVRRVVSAVPVSFDGVLDLCVCHPTALVVRLRRDRPNCLIKRTRGETSLLFWLQVYDVLFGLLRTEPMPYSTALERVLLEFLRK